MSKIEVVEVCPQCGEENVMQWDVKADGYKAFCPYCGNRLMLCDECMHPDGEYNGGFCDYNSETETCRYNDEAKPNGIDRLLNRDGELIVRVCHYPEYREGDAPCYGCVKRTDCNRDLFERLCKYEETGLSPEEIEAMKRSKFKYVKCTHCSR